MTAIYDFLNTMRLQGKLSDANIDKIQTNGRLTIDEATQLKTVIPNGTTN